MINQKTVEDARVAGFVFICAMCRRLHRGRDAGMTNEHGEFRCTSQECKSPLGGGMFEDYDGPLDRYLHQYCFVCGKPFPEHVLGAKDSSSGRIGCCARCLEAVQAKAVDRSTGGRRIIWTTEKRVTPERYEVIG